MRCDQGTGIRRTPIKAYAESRCAAVGTNASVVGDKLVFRVLRGHPALKRVAAQADSVLRRHAALCLADTRALGHADLGLDDVDAGHFLGDGVFHLYAGIDLDEVKRARIGLHEEFHGAGVSVTGGGCEVQGMAAKRVALPGIQIGRRRTLNQLLVAPLHRAVAFEEMDQVAVGIAQYLHFNVAGLTHEFFQVDLIVAESREGFAPRHGDFRAQTGRIVDHPHPASAAAPTGLEHQRKAHDFGQLERGVEIVGERAGGRHHRHTGRLRELPRAHLVSDLAHHVARRPDEDQPGRAAGVGELGVLGEKAVARVHGVDPGFPGDAQDGPNVQVGAQCLAGFAYGIALIGLEPMQRKAVFVRVNGNRSDAEFAGRAHHANGDLATVGNQQFVNSMGH